MKKEILMASVLLLAGAAAQAGAGGELHGTVTTADGATHTGVLRWDRNENFWDDRLDAAKDAETYVEERENTFLFLGLRLPRWGGGGHWIRSALSVPFGHLVAVERVSRDRARLELKGGTTLEVRARSTDLGPGMRGLEVTESGGGTVDLDWAAVKRVEFTPSTGAGRDGDRLYGVVEARSGAFAGFVVWDRDEALLGDVLDARDGGRSLELPFSRIARIERQGSRHSRVTQRDGGVILLQGTNDVDSDNRGILVQVTGLGQVEVPWDEFVSLTLQAAPPSPGYHAFDGGRHLTGRLKLADGTTASGAIVWDRDEAFSWETLDGEAGGLSYAIPFGLIRSIRRSSRHGAEVTLADGRVLELRGTNDVDQTNKGISVREADGRQVETDWDGFDTLDLTAP